MRGNPSAGAKATAGPFDKLRAGSSTSSGQALRLRGSQNARTTSLRMTALGSAPGRCCANRLAHRCVDGKRRILLLCVCDVEEAEEEEDCEDVEHPVLFESVARLSGEDSQEGVAGEAEAEAVGD